MTEISNVEEILTQAAVAAFDGEMDDAMRVSLYELALTIAAEELYRVEEVVGGVVNPGALLLIQQIGTLADPDIEPEKLLANIEHTVKEAELVEEEEISWEGEQASS